MRFFCIFVIPLSSHHGERMWAHGPKHDRAGLTGRAGGLKNSDDSDVKSGRGWGSFFFIIWRWTLSGRQRRSTSCFKPPSGNLGHHQHTLKPEDLFLIITPFLEKTDAAKKKREMENKNKDRYKRRAFSLCLKWFFSATCSHPVYQSLEAVHSETSSVGQLRQFHSGGGSSVDRFVIYKLAQPWVITSHTPCLLCYTSVSAQQERAQCTQKTTVWVYI